MGPAIALVDPMVAGIVNVLPCPVFGSLPGVCGRLAHPA
jgi:hypothetical protein